MDAVAEETQEPRIVKLVLIDLRTGHVDEETLVGAGQILIDLEAATDEDKAFEIEHGVPALRKRLQTVHDELELLRGRLSNARTALIGVMLSDSIEQAKARARWGSGHEPELSI